MAKIVAITTDFGNTPSPLAAQHVRYYAPEVDRYIFVLHDGATAADDYREQLAEAASSNVVVVHKSDLPPFSGDGPNPFDETKDHYEEEALKRFQVDGDAFVLHLDLDEFHVYPVPLRELVRTMEGKSKPALLGYFRDRLKLNHDCTRVLLEPVDPRSDLGTQFPWSATYARDMIEPAPCEEKIMIARRLVGLGHGRHHIRGANGSRDDGATSAAKCWSNLNSDWGGDHFYVHHFRWTTHTLNTLSKVLDSPQDYDPTYVQEVEGLKLLRCENDTLLFNRDVRCRCHTGGLPCSGLSY